MARYEIRNPLSKSHFKHALFDFEDDHEPREIHVVLWSSETEHTFEREMRVHVVGRIRGKNQWLLIGEIDSPPLSGIVLTDWGKSISVQGTYDTQSGKGFLETLPDSFNEMLRLINPFVQLGLAQT